VVDVDFLISNIEKSKYLLVDIDVLLRANVLDITVQ